MTYTEARKTYAALFSAHNDVSTVWKEDETDRNIICITERYVKHGSRWKQTESTTESVNYVYYFNTVDPRAVEFFRNLGGYERTICTYTKRGHIPTKIISINPDRTAKTVRIFKF